jgi:heme-degrading monooxygenase HmoA
MPTTEIALIPLTPETSIGDPSNPGAAVLKDVSTTLHQQPGFRSMHFGTQVESPNILQMFFDWDSRSDHEAFIASEAYGPHLQRCATIMAGPVEIAHVDFEPAGALGRALGAPVTEIATFYCEGEPGGEWMGNAAKAREWLAREGAEAGYLDVAYGITHEEVEYKGVKGKAAVIAVGWTSKEAHMGFRETQTFKENIGLLRGEAKAIEMHHVVMMQALE